MTRVYIADAKPEERSALCLLIFDLKMDLAGEAADWPTTLAQVPISRTDLLLVDWELLPSEPSAATAELRTACPAALVIVLISHLDARQQAALSAGADAFISKWLGTPAATARKRSATRSGISPLLIKASAPAESAAC